MFSLGSSAFVALVVPLPPPKTRSMSPSIAAKSLFPLVQILTFESIRYSFIFSKKVLKKKKKLKLGGAANTHHPNIQEAEAGRH